MAKATIELDIKGNLAQVAKDASSIKANLEAAAKVRLAERAISSVPKVSSSTRGQAPQTFQDSGASDTNLSRGIAGQTKASARDFAKQAQGLGGLVHVYATFAANIFAISAAFSALSKAADTTNMVKGLDQLGAASGRNLGSLAKQLTAATDGAISFRDAMTATAQASAGGMTNAAILRMGNVAKQASQALGVAMPDAMSRLSRGITKLEPELLDEIGIMVRVDTASQNYARSIGKSASALTDFEKRQGFANAVLEQGEKKFGAIQIDANPYAKILASMENIAQKGLELVNVVLGPLVSLLGSSPTALSAAMVGIAAILLKQAIPAMGMFKENLKLATENAQQMANLKSLEAKKATISGIAHAKQLAEARAEIEVANVDAAVKKISAIRDKDFSKASATNRILQKAAQDVTEKDFKLLESNAKIQDTRGKPLLAQAYREAALAIKDSQAAETAFTAAVAKGTKELSENISARKTAGQVQAIADRANLEASARSIKSQAAETASVQGFTAAWKEANLAIAKARSGPSSKLIEVTSLDELGNKVTNLEKITTPKMGAMQAGWTRLGVGIGAATGAIGTLMNFMGPWVFAIGLVIGAFELVSSALSTNSKEASKFSESIDATTSSIASMSRTLDAITSKDPLEIFSVQTIQARANALQGLSDTLGTLLKDFGNLKQASSWWDNAIDSLWDAIGRGAADKLSSNIAGSISAGLSSLEKGPLKEEAILKIQKLLGKGIDITNIKLVNSELRKLNNSEVLAIGVDIDKVFKAISREASNTAGNLTGVLGNLAELAKLVQTQKASLMPTDAVGKLGATMISSASELSLALKDPINSILILQDLVGDMNKLSILSPTVSSELLANKKRIDELSESYGALQKQVLEEEGKLQKLKDAGKFTEMETDAGGNVTEVKTTMASIVEDSIAEITVSSAKIRADIISTTTSLSAKVSSDFVNVGLKNLASSLTAAVAEGGIVAARGYLSVLKDAGMQTAEAEGALRAQELGMQKQILDATYAQIRQQQQNTNTLELNNVGMALLANQLALSYARTPEMEKAAKDEKASLDARLKELVQKSALTNMSPQQASKVKGGEDYSDKVLSEMSGYLSSMTGYLSGIAKISGQDAANRIATFAATKKEETAATQKTNVQSISGIDRQLAEVSSLVSVSSEYSSILQKKKDSLEADKRTLLYVNQMLDIQTKLVILEEAGKLAGIDKAKQEKAIEAAKTQGYENTKKFEQDNAIAKLDSLKEILKGEETLRSLEAARFAQTLADTQAITNAKLAQQESEVQYLTTIGALTAEESTRKLANIALDQQALQYTKESAALKAEMETRAAALSTTIVTQAASGQDTSKTVEEFTVLEASYTRQKTALDLINQTKVTSITLTAEHKALQEAQTEQMEKMVSVTQSLTSVFGELGASIGKAGEAILKMGQDDEKYALAKLKLQAKESDVSLGIEEQAKATKDLSKLDKKASQDKLSNLSNIVGATKGMFKEHTFAAKALGALEKGIHIVKMAQMVQAMLMDNTATANSMGNSIMAAGKSIVAGAAKLFEEGGYAGFIAVPIMLALLASLGGGGGGGASVSMAGMTSADKQETQGTGQSWVNGIKTDTGSGVFGDSEAKSTAIADSLEIMKDNSIEGLDYDNKLLKAMEKVAIAVTGVASSVYQIPGVRVGSGFGTVEGTTGKSILGWGKSTSTAIQDAGVSISGAFTDLAEASSNTVKQYETVLTTVAKSSWFGLSKSSSSSVSTIEKPLEDPKLQQAFADIFRNATSVFTEIGKSAGITEESITNTLKTLPISITTSLKGLTGPEMEAELNATIGSALSIASETLFKGIFDQFNKFGEDYLTTVVRVVDSNNKVDMALRSIGNSFSVLTRFNISEMMIKNAGSLSTFMEQASFFKETFLSEAEQLVPVQKSVNEELTRLGISSTITRDQFKDLVLAQDLNSAAGQSLYQSLMELAPGFDQVSAAVANALEEVLKVRSSWQDKLDVLQGTKTQRELTLRNDLASTTDTATLAIIRQIYAYEDLKTSLDTSLKAIQTSTDQAYSALEKAVAEQRKVATLAQTAATEQVTAIKSVFDLLKSSVQELYAEVDTTALMSAKAATLLIEQAISTGVLPKAEELSPAISAAKAGLAATAYASSFEASRDRLVLAGKLAQLKGVSETQLTTAERHLEAAKKALTDLDEILLTAKAQIDVLRGIDTSVMSVASAIAGLAVAIAAEKAAIAKVDSTPAYAGAKNMAAEQAASSAALMGKVTDYAADKPDNAYYFVPGVNDLAAKLEGAAGLAGPLGMTTEQALEYSTGHTAAYWKEAESQFYAGKVPTTTSIMGFAKGGLHDGGLRLVGENGPELEVTGPSRIYNNRDTASMLNGSNTEMANELKALREENKAQARAIVQLNSRMVKLLERWDNNGLPETRLVV